MHFIHDSDASSFVRVALNEATHVKYFMGAVSRERLRAAAPEAERASFQAGNAALRPRGEPPAVTQQRQGEYKQIKVLTK